jgi:hypothetical protein
VNNASRLPWRFIFAVLGPGHCRAPFSVEGQSAAAYNINAARKPSRSKGAGMKRLSAVICVFLAATFSFGAQETQDTNPLDAIQPGKTTRAELDALLGAPTGKADACERFAATTSGIKEMVAWYDGDVLDFARLTLQNDLSPAAAAILFGAAGSGDIRKGNLFTASNNDLSYTIAYVSGGTYFVVSGDVVKEIWRTKPAAIPEDIAKRGTVPEFTATPVAAAAVPRELPPPQGETGAPLPAPVAAGDSGGIGRGDFTASAAAGAPPQGVSVASAPYGAPTTREAGVEAIARYLGVPLVWHQSAVGAEGLPIIDAFARVETGGLKDKEIRMSAMLRPADTATTEAKEKFTLTDKVQYDNSAWQQASIAIRGGAVPDSQAGAILRWQVECDGLQAHAEADYAAASGAPRSISVSNIQCEHNAVLGDSTGMWAYAAIVASNVRGRSVAAKVRFRLPDGSPVKAVDGAAWAADADGTCALSQQDVAQYDTANWTPFRIFVPYRVLALSSGGHKLIMTYSAQCDTISSAAEKEIDVVVP